MLWLTFSKIWMITINQRYSDPMTFRSDVMRYKRQFMGLLITLSLILGSGHTVASGKPIELSAVLKDNRAGQATIVFTLKNQGKTIEIAKAGVPWGNQRSTMIKIVGETGQLMPEWRPISDPSYERITFPSGEKLSGEIVLARRFPNFESLRKTHELIIFWTYKPWDHDPLSVLPRSGGWFSVGPTKKVDHHETDHKHSGD